MMNPPASRGLVPAPVPVEATAPAAPAAAPARQPLSLGGDRDTGTTTTMTESTKQSEAQAVMSLAELRQRRLAAFVGRTSVAQQLQPIDNVQSHAKAKANATAPAPALAAVNRNLHSTMTAAPVVTIDLCTSSSDDNEDEQDNDNDNDSDSDIDNNNNKRHIDNSTTKDNEDISQSFLQEIQLQTPPHWQSTSLSPPQQNRIHRKRAHRHCSNNSKSDSPHRSIHIPTDPAIVRTTMTIRSSNPSSASASSASASSPASSQRKLSVAGIKAPPTTAKAAATTAQPVPPPASFQVASYNLWFGPAGDGAPHAAKRMQAVAQLLLDANTNDNDNKPLLFIAFQEVIPALAQHLFPLLRQAGYTVLRQPYDPQYGCALAVYTGNGSSTGAVTVIEKGWQPFSGSVMERGLLYVRAQLPSQQQQVLVTCTHLESFMNARSNGSQQRCQQAEKMASFCFEQWQRHEPHLIATISMGDMNWDDTSKSQSKEPPMLSIMMESIQNESNNNKRNRRSINSNNFLFCDAWLETIGAARPTTSRRGGGGAGVDDTTAGFTYDGKRNPMLSNQLRRRFDRCIVGVGIHGNGGGTDDSSTSAMLHPVACQLLGMEALPGLTWEKQNPWKNTITTALTAPSDHFGLLVHVQQ